MEKQLSEKRIFTSELIKILTYSFKVFTHECKIIEHPAVFLKGHHGVGKSQAVYKIAKILEESLNKKSYCFGYKTFNV
jgi:signal recognition particle GTPase